MLKARPRGASRNSASPAIVQGAAGVTRDNAGVGVKLADVYRAQVTLAAALLWP